MPKADQKTLRDGATADKDGRDITISFSAKALFALLAFGLYWGFVFTAYWGTPFLAGSFDAHEAMLQRICAALGGQAVAFGIFFLLWQRLSSRWGIHLMEGLSIVLCTIGGMPALCQALGVGISHPVAMVCLFLFGCGHALLLCRIGFLVDALTGPSMLPATAVSAFVSCAVFVTVTHLEGIAQPIVLVVLSWACCACALASRACGTVIPTEFAGCCLKDCSNDGAAAEFGQFCVQILLYSIVFALAQMLAAWYREGPQTDSFWIAIAAAGVVMLAYSLFVKRYVSPPVFMWYLLPVIALGALPIAIVDPGQRAVCWLVVGFGFTVFDLMSFQSLSSFIKFNNLSIVRYFSIGRLANSVGMVVGWAVGLALFTAIEPDPKSIGLLFIGLIVVLITVMCLTTRERRPTDEEPGVPETSPAGVRFAEQRRPWMDAVSEISREAGLSPREEEVFMLLSRGRTARYIGEHLFISAATAKTHIYRIYQKLDIKSQQTLIDLVEERYGGVPGDDIGAGRRTHSAESGLSGCEDESPLSGV